VQLFSRSSVAQRALGIGRPDLANRWSVRIWHCLGYGHLIENIIEKTGMESGQNSSRGVFILTAHPGTIRGVNRSGDRVGSLRHNNEGPHLPASAPGLGPFLLCFGTRSGLVSLSERVESAFDTMASRLAFSLHPGG